MLNHVYLEKGPWAMGKWQIDKFGQSHQEVTAHLLN